MSPLSGIERHPHARAVLGPALPPIGSPSHAYLFCGPSGSGKSHVAREFAAALLSEGAGDPAGAADRVRSGAHPDLTWVAPASSAGILVGDVDEAVVSAAVRTPFEARRRVFVIERADELNEQAANRMLKTLEEPPPFAHLVLLTSRPGNVLPTIASRCQRVRFDAPGSAEIARRLERDGVDGEVAAACSRLALGDAELAARLAGEEGSKMRAAAEAVARGAIAGDVAASPWGALLDNARAQGDGAVAELRAALDADIELLPAKEKRRAEREADELGRRAHRRAAADALDVGLRLVGLWLRDVACVAEGAPELAHAVDRIAELRADAERAAVHRLREAVAAVDEARASLALNPTWELALEALAYRLEETLAR